jgi:23S rRNA (uracil747-C5)-methyltransferase
MKCSYYKEAQCQSCQLLDKSYEETLLLKEAVLGKLFPGTLALMKPTVGLKSDVEKSRSKAKFAVFSFNNEMTFGYYQSNGTATELENCPLHASGINELLVMLKDQLKIFNILPYDLKTKTGELKYILISKSGEASQNLPEEYLLRFVLRSKESLDRLKKAVQSIQSLVPKIKVITANIQPIHQAIIEGEIEIVLSEEVSITHHFDEFALNLGARSFFQVTPAMGIRLYNAVADEISTHSPKSLIDLYCGVGAFSFYASRHCSDITGVEISAEAIECAKSSLNLNKSAKIDFYALDVEEYLKKSPKKFEAVIVNPPRRGLNSAIIKNILEINPQTIYYSSCNAETLQRDFLELEAKYKIISLQIFDMFPFTHHFETLMCLKRI